MYKTRAEKAHHFGAALAEAVEALLKVGRPPALRVELAPQLQCLDLVRARLRARGRRVGRLRKRAAANQEARQDRRKIIGARR